jgi:hypothetical protein
LFLPFMSVQTDLKVPLNPPRYEDAV